MRSKLASGFLDCYSWDSKYITSGTNKIEVPRNVRNSRAWKQGSLGEIGLNIRTHASPNLGQAHVFGGVSVRFIYNKLSPFLISFKFILVVRSFSPSTNMLWYVKKLLCYKKRINLNRKSSHIYRDGITIVNKTSKYTNKQRPSQDIKFVHESCVK